jgi:glucosamine-6-phosphate deaminase
LEQDNPRSCRFQLNDSLAKLAPFLAFHFVNSLGGAEECSRLEQLVAAHPIDVAFVSVGDSGQLGLNDPPNLESAEPYVSVTLSDACRGQVVHEGHFKTKDEVPKEAITLSLQQIMKSKQIVAVVTGKRKAIAVKNVTEVSKVVCCECLTRA